ncbi:hypothetical protein GCM10027610_057650 [Dactylosporangium cerinum]
MSQGSAQLSAAGQKIEARHLTKRYGATTAVHDLSFDVRPGLVTGFIGPNGAGKTTTMRMILGLDRPSGGDVTVGGRRYRDLPAPMREVGALIDAKAIHPGRSAYHHLLSLAQSNGIPAARATEVLGLVGLDAVGGRRVGGFSSACASGSGSPRRCSATLRSSCSTNPSTAWTLKASCGSGS